MALKRLDSTEIPTCRATRNVPLRTPDEPLARWLEYARKARTTQSASDPKRSREGTADRRRILIERLRISEPTKAGLQRALRAGKKLGRPGIDLEAERKIHALHHKGVSLRKIAAQTGFSLSTVVRQLSSSR